MLEKSSAIGAKCSISGSPREAYEDIGAVARYGSGVLEKLSGMSETGFR